MIEHEMVTRGLSREEVFDMMQLNLDTMRDAVEKGSTGEGVKVSQDIQDKMPLKLQNIMTHIKHFQDTI